MAFLNLRNNHLIYILHKNIPPTLEIGKVVNMTLPVPKYGANSMYNDLVLDITVESNGKNISFLKIPANSEIADFGNNTVISTDKQAMSSEVMSMKLKSLDIINSKELNETIVLGCDEILEILNPEIAEKLRQELENRELRQEINTLKEMFSEFINQFKN